MAIPDDAYHVNPMLTVRCSLADKDEIQVLVGEGSKRQEFLFSDAAIVAAIFTCGNGGSGSEIVNALCAELGLAMEDGMRLFGTLVEREILVRPAETSPATSLWERWGWRDALDFHAATTNVIWRHSYKDGAAKPDVMTYFLDDELAEAGRPKPQGRERHASTEYSRLLPPSDRLRHVPFTEALSRRRTKRVFQDTPMSKADLSDILHHSMTVMNHPPHRPYRASPTYSLGDFFSAFCVIMNVDGVAPGVYRYDSELGSLAVVRTGFYDSQMVSFSQDQPFVKNAAVVLFITVRWEQYMWKYRLARTYRLALFEISGLVQTILIAAAALQIGSFITPAISDSDVARFLGIEDMLVECPLYLIGLGHSGGDADVESAV